MGFVDGGSLLVRIRCAFGANLAADPLTWTWTDITQWWHVDDQVDLSWGSSSGASKLETANLGLSLKNTDSRFTAYHPASPYWPHVREWVPIQYDIDLGDGAGWRNKFSGFVKNWAVRWPGASALMATCRIAAVGELGRRERGRPPARSPMRRTLAASGPAAYWPGEDGGDATGTASVIAGHSPMTVSGTVTFEQVDDWVTPGGNFEIGTAPLADLAAGGSLAVSVPAAVTAATGSAWTIQCFAKTDFNTSSGDIVLLEWTTPGGTYVKWQLKIVQATLRTQVIGFNSADTPTTIIDRNGVSVGQINTRVTAEQSGGNINVNLYMDTDTATATATTAATLAGIASITANANNSTNTGAFPFGHLVVWASATPDFRLASLTDSYGVAVRSPKFAYLHETAHDRLARLCAAEEGVSLTAPGVSADFVTRMGPQPVGTFLDLVGQCVDADQGLLREDGFGFGFVPREHRYNQPVALTIDAAAGQLGMPFEPVSDDPNRRNMWTVKREGGSSAVVRDQALIDVQGEIEGSITVRHADDSLLEKHAFSRLRQTTVQEPRYPALSVNLGANPDLAAAWCAVRRGSRIQVVNPPPQNVPGTIDQIVVGAREVWRGRRDWKATMNVEPAQPWTFITDTFTRTVGGGWGTADSGHVWTTSGGGSASDYSVNGTLGLHSLGSVNVARESRVAVGFANGEIVIDGIGVSAAPTGAGCTHAIRARYVDGGNFVDVRLFRGVSGSVGINVRQVVAGVETFSAFPTVPAVTSTSAISIRFGWIGSTLRAKAWPTGGAVPATWQVEMVATFLSAGDVAIRSSLDAGNTNSLPVVVDYDNVTEVRF